MLIYIGMALIFYFVSEHERFLIIYEFSQELHAS